MRIPKNIKVTDATGKTVALLSPKADGLKDCCPDTRLNGESTLEFLLPATSEKIDELTPECEIWANDRVYIIRKDDAIDIVRDDNNKLWAKVMAFEKWYELDESYVEPSISNDPTARPPADLAVIIVGGGSNLSGSLYPVGTAGHALYAILEGSGWTLGECDVTGIRDMEAEKESRLSLVKKVQEIWGGYLLFDSINKVIHLRDAGKWQPYTGFQVRYRKNLKHITRTQSNKIVTKLYAFGHDDLDIANVNGGKKYITNNSYTSREYVDIYKNQDIYDQEELLEKATAELELICGPRYLYKIKLVDVRILPEYSHESFTLGDMADVIDPDVAPDKPRPRIIRHKYNLFQPWDCELDIGDPEERLIEKLKASFGTTQFIDGKFKGNGEFSGHSLEYESISADKIKVDELVVGDNIRMGPNARISWGNVDNQPLIPDGAYITEITNNTIRTTNVLAQNLTVRAANITGALTANQIDISTITRIGDYPHSYLQISSGGLMIQNPDMFGRGALRLNIGYEGFTHLGDFITFSTDRNIEGFDFSDRVVINQYGGRPGGLFVRGLTELVGSVSISQGNLNLTNVNNVQGFSASYISSGTISHLRLPIGTTSTTVAIGNHTHDREYVKIPYPTLAFQANLNANNTGIIIRDMDGNNLGTIPIP